MNRRYARNAVIAATIVETIPLAIGLWALVTMGRHPGGAIFAIVHFPAILVLFALDPVLENFLDLGLFSIAEALSLVLVVVIQVCFFATAIYWVIKFWRRNKDA